MVPLAYSNVGAQYAFYLELGMFGASEWSIRYRSRMNRGGRQRDRGSLYVVILAAVLGVVAAFVFAHDMRGAFRSRLKVRVCSPSSRTSRSTGWRSSRNDELNPGKPRRRSAADRRFGFPGPDSKPYRGPTPEYGFRRT
jgi:hypothetical protein